jgi:hypothetical protein
VPREDFVYHRRIAAHRDQIAIDYDLYVEKIDDLLNGLRDGKADKRSPETNPKSSLARRGLAGRTRRLVRNRTNYLLASHAVTIIR